MKRREVLKMTSLVLGYSVTGFAVQGILQGCKPKIELDWKPEFFSDLEASVVSDIVDIILPETDTPGAVSVGVPSFIDTLLLDYSNADEQKSFQNGIKELIELVEEKYKKSFIKLKLPEKNEFIREIHEEAVATYKPNQESPFILKVKELTLLGYFTSELGATKILQYLPVPGRYNGCVPLETIGRA